MNSRNIKSPAMSRLAGAETGRLTAPGCPRPAGQSAEPASATSSHSLRHRRTRLVDHRSKAFKIGGVFGAPTLEQPKAFPVVGCQPPPASARSAKFSARPAAATPQKSARCPAPWSTRRSGGDGHADVDHHGVLKGRSSTRTPRQVGPVQLDREIAGEQAHGAGLQIRRHHVKV